MCRYFDTPSNEIRESGAAACRKRKKALLTRCLDFLFHTLFCGIIYHFLNNLNNKPFTLNQFK